MHFSLRILSERNPTENQHVIHYIPFNDKKGCVWFAVSTRIIGSICFVIQLIQTSIWKIFWSPPFKN